MATLFTIVGCCPPGTSTAGQAARIAKATEARRARLDWYECATLTFRCVSATGALANIVRNSLGLRPVTACIARLDKNADPVDGWRDLASMFDRFENGSGLIRSDGAVLALRIENEVWLSDLAERVEDADGWIAVASDHYGGAAKLLDQDQVQARF